MAANFRKTLTYAILIVWFLAVVLPLWWVFQNSLRSSQEIFRNPFGTPWLFTGAPPDVSPDAPVQAIRDNYFNAWVKSQFSSYFLNSLVVTAASLAGILAFSAMAAYVIARFPFRGNRAVFLYFISGMMVPAQLVLVPLFFEFTYLSRWGSRLLAPLGLEVQLHDTITGLVTIYIALSLPFTILVLTGFFKSLPGELREAGIMDGCGEYRVFWHVMLPLAKPGIVTAAIFNFLGIWNEYLFALVFVNSSDNKTLPLGLAAVSIQAQYKTDFGLMFAGLVIVMIPTLFVYLLLQRHLTRGITLGALKG
ncbi:MAG: carbohydrate ABC transporter permease [Candidatus Hydrogenedentes bacterium]|nr:carbohydrate ABC transporter permease [Candidatus Hydrogenedentota bacterium]